MRKVSKVHFLIHPVCWASAMPEGKPPPAARLLDWQEYYETEKQVRQKQDQLIASLREDDLLLLFPIFREKEPMRRLEEFCTKTLGDRCIIIQTEAPGARTSGWIQCLPEEFSGQLAEEIIEACIKSGYDWSARALKVAYTQRAYALEIESAMQQRGLTWDTEAVDCQAFGESFEGCCMTWKSMLPHYLGLANPIENNFELSVSDAPALLRARFLERVAFADDVRLFLWEGADGRPIGMYCRARARLKDRQLFARIPLEGMEVQVRDVSHTQWWPPLETPPLSVALEGEELRLPVYAATRKTPLDTSYYIIGENVSVQDFSLRMKNATVGE